MTRHTVVQMSENLYRIKPRLINGSLTTKEALMVQELLFEKRAQSYAPVSGIQEKAMNEGLDVTYTVDHMIIPGLEKVVKVQPSRVPIDPTYYAAGKTSVRVGSDLLACFLGALTKFEKDIVPSMPMDSFTSRGYVSMKNPQFIHALIPMMRDCGILENRDPNTGCKGREWVFHIMRQLQRTPEVPYAYIHTYVCVKLFGLVTWTGTSFRVQDDLKDFFFVNSCKTDLYPQSVFWKGPLPKGCRVCFNSQSPTPAETYKAASESLAFRGGVGSAVGCLLLSADSWGFPTHARANLELDLSLILGMEQDVVIYGCNEQRAALIVASATHYKFSHTLHFLVDRSKTLQQGTGINYVYEAPPKSVYYQRIDAPLSTTIKKKKESAVEQYDPAKVMYVGSEAYDNMISKFPTTEAFMFVCPYIPQDSTQHNMAIVKTPFDCVIGISSTKLFRRASSSDAVTLTFEKLEYLGAQDMRTRQVKVMNASLGIFFGMQRFNAYASANLVRPLASKARKIYTYEHYDNDGNSIVDYWYVDEQGHIVPEANKPQAPATTTTPTTTTTADVPPRMTEMKVEELPM